jgi:hypothetical protein
MGHLGACSILLYALYLTLLAGSTPSRIFMRLRLRHYCKASQNVKKELINCVVSVIVIIYCIYVEHQETLEPEQHRVTAAAPTKLCSSANLQKKLTLMDLSPLIANPLASKKVR